MNNPLTQKKTAADMVMIVTILLMIVWMAITENLNYIPSGNVIDEDFLNSLKWMAALKYLVMFAGFGVFFGAISVKGFKSESRRNKIIIVATIAVVVIALAIIIAPHAEGAYKGIVETPSVSEEVVTDKNYSNRGKTHTVYLDSGMFAHVSKFQYDRIETGDNVYVVWCDGVAIGVFSTDDYTLGI